MNFCFPLIHVENVQRNEGDGGDKKKKNFFLQLFTDVFIFKAAPMI